MNAQQEKALRAIEKEVVSIGGLWKVLFKEDEDRYFCKTGRIVEDLVFAGLVRLHDGGLFLTKAGVKKLMELDAPKAVPSLPGQQTLWSEENETP